MKSSFDWLCVSCLFKPYAFTADDGSGRVGCQILLAAAVSDNGIRALETKAVEPHDPGPFASADLERFLAAVAAEHGKPRAGVMVMAEVWMSTEVILAAPALADRVKFLALTGEAWGEMPPSERLLFERHMQSAGLQVEWATTDRPAWN